MIDYKKIAEGIKGSFDSFEVFFLKEKTKKYESRDLDTYSIELREEEGVALRVIKDNKMAFSYSYEKGDKALESLLDNARQLLPFLDEDKDYAFPEPTHDYPILDLYDSKGLILSESKKKDMVISLEDIMKNYDKRISVVRGCELQEIEIETGIINSKGISVEAKKTLYIISGMCVAKDTDEVSWYDWQWSHFLNEMDIKGFGEGVAKKAVSFLGSTQIDTGIYKGILKPRAACDILGILSGSFLAESLFKDKTRLKDRIGKRCFSNYINITESGMVGIDASAFDAEGTPGQEKRIVRDGVFETFLYDTYYGKKYGRASTGNSIRTGLKDPPRCGIRGIYIEKSDKGVVDDTMEEVVIIEELIGTHTANPITGEFSLGAIGYLRKKGEYRPFKEVIFSGDIFELLNNVLGVGSDLRFYGNCGSPSLLIEGIKISGR
ncbi:MAG: TldD/PmbA family protein [Syntrophorhabdaceae bacterium]|nr:TldD/PmbA family protein [Syntrophorhabdaceae bacterium]